ncbi:MAG: hypothetical protein IPI32_04835 [Austwickia sp.]|nr:hypothetical protein [Austwickia sp.]MBK8436955.1 hypothetical protein [Austwickia sp.]MBK9100582.1 hypothetical protein [Austwickia sp.]
MATHLFTARGAATMLLLGSSGFQAALAAGAPWAHLAYGGGHSGTLPGHLRATSAVATVAYAALAATVARRPLPETGQRRLQSGAAALFTVGTALNLASPSLPEKLTWSPVAAALAISLWRSRAEPVKARS